jgi:hypothetical protein
MHTRALDFCRSQTGRDEISSSGDDFYGLSHFSFPVRSLVAADPVSIFLPRTARSVYDGQTCTHNTVTKFNARENAHTRDNTHKRV